MNISKAHEPKKYEYFVGKDKYVSDLPELTGAQIKAKIPNLDPAFILSLEGHGRDPDRVIGDNDKVSLESKHGPLRFTLVPPANFG